MLCGKSIESSGFVQIHWLGQGYRLVDHKIYIFGSQSRLSGAEKMKHFEVFISAIFILACLALPCMALESRVLTVTEKTLSVDLGPSFELNKSELNTSQKGMVSQDFLINNTAKEGVAFFSVMSVYDDLMKRLSPDLLSELFLL